MITVLKCKNDFSPNSKRTCRMCAQAVTKVIKKEMSHCLFHSVNPLDLMEKTILFGAIKCVVSYFLYDYLCSQELASSYLAVLTLITKFCGY